jgi:hypothetical protein
MATDQGARPRDHKLFAKRTVVALPKDRAHIGGAAAAYDTQENDLITKSRKIITASRRAVRDAEAVLKRR